MSLTAVPLNVQWTIGGIFTVLAFASIVTVIIGWSRPGIQLFELKARIRTWWRMAALFSIAVVLSRTVSLVFLAFVSFLALKEYFSLIPTRRADRAVLAFAYLAIPIQFCWVGIAWYGMFIIFVPVYMFLLLPVPMLIIGQTQGFLRAVGTLHWGLMANVYSISHAAFLLALPPLGNPVAGGAGLLLYLVLLTEGNDVAQYLWGKLLGRRKVIPKVSPNKTWEGFVGGVATTVVLGLLLGRWLTPLHGLHALAAGLLIGLAGFAGDLTISALKRDLGIKDSGSMLPGHGGVLDRLDSLIYTAPLFFHFVRYFYY